MKRVCRTISILLCLWSTNSIAGHETGNGGGGLVCRESGHITSVKLLDFWEAESLRNLQIVASGTAEEMIGRASARLVELTSNEKLGDFIQKTALRIMKSKMNFLKELGIASPRDVLNRYIQKQCNIEGVASFDDVYDVLDVDKELYDQLLERDKAGLIFHEATYLALRTYFNQENSLLARYMTGCAFSSGDCSALNVKGGLPSGSISCFSGDTGAESHFSIYDVNGSNLRVQFEKLSGNSLLARSFVDLDSGFRCHLQDARLICDNALAGQSTYTRSSEDRWLDVRINEKVSFSVGKVDSELQINGSSAIKCLRGN